jgi:glycosyltransferase involved in cell wall biosynthesis
LTVTRPLTGADERLTVCHLFSGDLWAGAEVVILNLLSTLRGDPTLRLLALSLNEGVLTQRLRAAGVTTHVIAESQHSVVGILRRAVPLLRHQRVTVVHSHRYKENVLAWLLARCLGSTGLVTTVHGVSEASTNKRLEQWIAQGRRRLDYFVLKRWFSAVVAVSDEMKRRLVEEYGFRRDQVSVIRNGGRFPARTSMTTGGQGPHVGTVARMVPVKGLDLFLDVAAAVKAEMPQVRFSILGDGPLREELIRRAGALTLDVEFLAPRPDAFAYYRSLDVYLNTSHHEGLPLSVVEAMACGKPVVSTAVGGISEIVEAGAHGFLVNGRDPRRLAEHCLTLLGDDRLRTSMGERAAVAAHTELSADAMAAAYRRLYQACVAPNIADTSAPGAVPFPDGAGSKR